MSSLWFLIHQTLLLATRELVHGAWCMVQPTSTAKASKASRASRASIIIRMAEDIDGNDSAPRMARYTSRYTATLLHCQLSHRFTSIHIAV